MLSDVSNWRGEFYFDPNVVKDKLVSYFKDIFNELESKRQVDPAVIFSGPRVKEVDCICMVRDVSFNEVIEVVRNLPSCKAVGPDGYNVEFYKVTWNIIGPDLVESIRSFMQTGNMPFSINSTYLALFPKGDPISPYLFTLVMEVLSRRLGLLKNAEGYSYHLKCARINLTHLMFTDDVIIFSKANVGSMIKLREALNIFSDWLGLKGVMNMKNIMAAIVNFQRGQLPFSYLGVPLDGKKIKGPAFNEVIDKMTSRIKAWSAKCLSDADRLVLVKHELSMVRGGLGQEKSGSLDISLQTKNAWRVGLKELMIWDLVLKKDSIWIRWMNHCYFKDKSSWQVEETSHHSWVKKKILGLREDARNCIIVFGNQPVSWRFGKNPFTTKGAYEKLDSRGPPKDWYDIVWNDLAHPKHNFCTWLAVIDRLPTTKGRLQVSTPIFNYLDLTGISTSWNLWDELITWKNRKRWSCREQKHLAFFIIVAAIYESWRELGTSKSLLGILLQQIR
ncbi:hypothetical protein QQ045_028364 [Rhodiola kirilowii]